MKVLKMKLKDYRIQLEKSKEFSDSKKELRLHFALADAVLEARMNKGWTQKELAKAIGTKQANISRIESGLANPTLEFLSRLSNVLNLKIQFECEQVPSIQFINEPAKDMFKSIYIYTKPIENLAFEFWGENIQTQEVKEFA